MRKISYALIGGGMMGLEHIRYVKKVPNARIQTIVEPNALQRSQCQKEIPDVEFTSLNSLKHRDDINAAIICTPNYTHFEILTFLFDSKIIGQ